MVYDFIDRSEAGNLLVAKLARFTGKNIVLLVIPRGGVVVGYQIHTQLKFEWGIVVVRKISAPFQPELGIGAIAEGGISIIDKRLSTYFHFSPAFLNNLKLEQLTELNRRVKVYRGNKRYPALKNKIAIIVDDGVATGITAKAAIMSIRKRQPQQIVFAVPVGSRRAIDDILPLVDTVVCLKVHRDFKSLGDYYRDFSQIDDTQVKKYLKPD